MIEPHFDRLFRLACRLTGSKSDAEDLIQEVVTRLFADPRPLEEAADPGPYLSRVLYHRFVDDRRAAARRPLTLIGHASALDVHAAPGNLEPELLDDAARTGLRLEQALARLSEDHRRLVLLHDAEGYTLTELATITGTPIGTLKSRLSRARARLRDLLWDFRKPHVPTSAEPFPPRRRVGG